MKKRFTFRRIGHALAFCALVSSFSLFLGAASVAGKDLPVSSRTKINGAVIPIFLKDDEPAAAVVKVGKVYTEYQRRGFFRIGLLPLAVAEGVDIEIRRETAASRALVRLPKELKPMAGARLLELRNVRLVFPSDDKERLRAGKAHWTDDGRWELSRSVYIRTRATEIEAPAAVLQVTGPAAGLVTWGTPDALKAYDIFEVSSQTTATNIGVNYLGTK